jgi:hypothetical protein
MTFTTLLAAVTALFFLLVMFLLTRNALRQGSGAGLILLMGFFFLLCGERILGYGDWRWPVTGMGLALGAGSIILRLRIRTRSEGRRKHAHRTALLTSLVAFSGVLFYAGSLEGLHAWMGLGEEASRRWTGSCHALTPIVVLLGLLPTLIIDRFLTLHPRELPSGITRYALESGVGSALVLCLLFPVNYLAHQRSTEWDHAYFRTTRPGTSTEALVRTLAEPIEATLFFAPGQDVGQEVEPYFAQLTEKSEGLFSYRRVDQALEAVESEALKIRDNGYVAFRQGEHTEKIKIGTNFDRAKKDLLQLDSMVHKHLLKLTRDRRTLYLLAGHGEANPRERDNPLRALNELKKDLEAANFTVKPFGVSEGSASTVPEDAAAILIASPSDPILPEEEEVLKEYVDRGGAIMLLLDPGDTAPRELLGHLGLTAGEGRLAHEQAFMRQTRGLTDRVLLVSNKFGSHQAVNTLSRNSQQMGMILPTVTWIDKLPESTRKVTPLIKSFPDTWEDLNKNFVPDEDETRKVFSFAVAVEDEDDEGTGARAIVVGDVNFLSDVAYLSFPGSRMFVRDAVRWLTRDEDIAGDIETEEDVKIVHTRDEDQLWFWGTVFLVPLMVLGVGVLSIFRRREKGQ